MRIIRAYKNVSAFYKVLGGFVIGIILGLIIGEPARHLQFLGTIMVRLVSMVVLPLVMSMIIVAVGDVGGKSVGKMGTISTVMFVISSILAIGVGLGFASLFNVGSGIQPDEAWVLGEVAAAPGVLDVLISIIPDNIFTALVRADLLQVLAFSIFMGIAIAALPNKKHSSMLIDLFTAISDVIQKVLSYVMEFMPLGVMGIMAWLVGRAGLASLLEFAPFLAACLAATVVIHLGIQVLLFAKILGGMSIRHFLKYSKESTLFVWATASSYATLPVAMDVARKMGIKEHVRNFVVPYGIVVNMDGTAAYLGIATVFVANVHGITLEPMSIVMIVVAATLGSLGAAGVPGAAVVMLVPVLGMLGLPPEAVVLLLGFDRLIPGPARGVCNIGGDFAVCAIVQRFVDKEIVGKGPHPDLVNVSEK